MPSNRVGCLQCLRSIERLGHTGGCRWGTSQCLRTAWVTLQCLCVPTCSQKSASCLLVLTWVGGSEASVGLASENRLFNCSGDHRRTDRAGHLVASWRPWQMSLSGKATPLLTKVMGVGGRGCLSASLGLCGPDHLGRLPGSFQGRECGQGCHASSEAAGGWAGSPGHFLGKLRVGHRWVSGVSRWLCPSRAWVELFPCSVTRR